MARLFDDASSQYLERASVPLSVSPYTFSAWFNQDATGVFGIVGFFDSTLINGRTWLDTGTGAGVRFPAESAGGISSNGTPVSSAAPSLNTWHHACGVSASPTNWAVFLDGGNKGTTSNTCTINVGIDRTSIGGLRDSTPSNYFSGMIAEVAIWNVALTDNEVAILGRGYSAMFVRPESLLVYYPILGYSSPEIDKFGLAITVSGATKASSHPRIRLPRRRKIYIPGVASTDILATTGTELWSGLGASINAGIHVTATTGVETWNGLGASINARVSITAGTGVETWNGLAANVGVASGIIATTGVETWNGISASVDIGGALQIQAATGTELWGGLFATVTAGGEVVGGNRTNRVFRPKGKRVIYQQ